MDKSLEKHKKLKILPQATHKQQKQDKKRTQQP